VIENRPGASSNIATSAVVRAAPDPFHYYAVDGGLISYGPDVPDQFRLAAGYVDRVLRSERPSELPVVQSTKFELVINLETAKALGDRRRGDPVKHAAGRGRSGRAGPVCYSVYIILTSLAWIRRCTPATCAHS